eukprot:4006798-Amphidinium_carterae.2
MIVRHLLWMQVAATSSRACPTTSPNQPEFAGTTLPSNSPKHQTTKGKCHHAHWSMGLWVLPFNNLKLQTDVASESMEHTSTSSYLDKLFMQYSQCNHFWCNHNQTVWLVTCVIIVYDLVEFVEHVLFYSLYFYGSSKLVL